MAWEVPVQNEWSDTGKFLDSQVQYLYENWYEQGSLLKFWGCFKGSKANAFLSTLEYCDYFLLAVCFAFRGSNDVIKLDGELIKLQICVITMVLCILAILLFPFKVLVVVVYHQIIPANILLRIKISIAKSRVEPLEWVDELNFLEIGFRYHALRFESMIIN